MDGTTPELFGEFQELLSGAEFAAYSRWDFYKECCKPSVKVAIMSGESRTFGNILLTIGVA